MPNKFYHILLPFLTVLCFLIIECQPKGAPFSEERYNYHKKGLNQYICDTGINSTIEFYGITPNSAWYDENQSPSNYFSIFALPPDSFYLHYEALKEMKRFPEYHADIDSMLQRALGMYAMALKIAFINENIFVNRDYYSFDDLILKRKLIDYNYNTFDIKKIDEDSILGSEKASDIKKEWLFRCKNCLLWSEFIHFYTRETNNSVYFEICKRNACKF